MSFREFCKLIFGTVFQKKEDEMIDWNKYPNFTKEEFDCSHTGLNEMNPYFLSVLQEIRTEFNSPMYITSGYRHLTHPVEARKKTPGEHTHGLAVDVGIYGSNAVKLIQIALNHEIPRIGIKQNGHVSGRFIHLGAARKDHGFPSPWIWSY